ncbi:MAG: hypothetical protein OXD42_10020, partial [Rhodospirillaceae bacterium]|nr:hypothetical protein [Rhodospirillaceae bacterium]
VVTFIQSQKGWRTPFDADRMADQKLVADMIDAKTGEVVAEAGQKVTPRLIKRLKDGGLKDRIASPEELIGSYVARD